jgi:peptidoglycan/LPS O-acetylase OafA/YrhL
MSNIGLYAKAIVAAASAAATTAITALQDGELSTADWLTIIGAFVVALGAVFATPNIPEGVRVYGKAIVAFVAAAVASLTTSFIDGTGLSLQETLGALVAGLAALGLTYGVSNAAESDPIDPETRKIIPVHNKGADGYCAAPDGGLA